MREAGGEASTQGVLQKVSWRFASSPEKEAVCQFPIAAGTNRHKHRGVKQHKIVISPFWRAEVPSGSYGAEVRALAGLVPSGGSRAGSIPFPLATS